MLLLVHDASERALGLLTTFNNEKITRNNQQKPIDWKMVSEVRLLQSDIAFSGERSTKNNFLKMYFSFFDY